jgi:hypothetical protein
VNERKTAGLFKTIRISTDHARTWKIVVETMGNTANKKMTHTRIVLEINAARAAARSSVCCCKIHQRLMRHTANIMHTKTIGATVVATSLIERYYEHHKLGDDSSKKACVPHLLWKFVSIMQLRGSADISNERKAKCPQIDSNIT